MQKNRRKNSKRCVKVILEFADGKIRYLEGADAQKYIDHINGALGFMQVTRSYMLPVDFLELSWKEIDKSKVGSIF